MMQCLQLLSIDQSCLVFILNVLPSTNDGILSDLEQEGTEATKKDKSNTEGGQDNWGFQKDNDDLEATGKK